MPSSRTYFSGGEGHLPGLPADEGVVVDDGVGQAQAVPGGDAHPLVAHAHFHGLEDPHGPGPEGHGPDAGFLDELHPGGGAAVQDGQLLAVHFDGDVVDAQSGQGGQEVLDGLEPDAVPGEGGGEAAVPDEGRGGGDLHPRGDVEEGDAGGPFSRAKDHGAGQIAVQAPARKCGGPAERLGVAIAVHKVLAERRARTMPIYNHLNKTI